MLGIKKKNKGVDPKGKGKPKTSASNAEPKVKAEPVAYETLITKHGEYQTTLTAAYKARKPWSAPDPKEVYSFIPGTILELTVPVGGTVKKGEKLLMFKAMKMNNTFLSPMDGTVKVIHVSVDEIVPKGRLLLEFE